MEGHFPVQIFKNPETVDWGERDRHRETDRDREKFTLVSSSFSIQINIFC